MWNLQKAFSLRTIKICRFEVIDGVKYVYGIKHVYNFLLREQAYFMVAYFCHHLSDNYVNLSDLYVDLSVIYVDLSEKYHYN